jgi:hypothetical protein
MTAPPATPTLGTLSAHGLLDAGSLPRARDLIAHDADSGRQGPWFLRALQIVGAWLAALFLIGFLEMAGFLESEGPRVVVAVAVIAVATVFSRLGRNLFAEQALTALSIAGHLILVFSLWESTSPWLAALAAVVLLLFTYPLFRVGVHRVFSCHFAAATLVFAAYEAGLPDLHHLVVALAATAVVLLHSGCAAAPFWRPAALSSVTVLLGILLLANFSAGVFAMRSGHEPVYHGWLAAIPVALVLPLLPLRLHRHGPGGTRVGILAGAAALAALALFTDPAIAAALWVFAIGHLLGDRIMGWLGAIAFATGLTFYYYDLGVSLISKSVSLVALGAACLLLRLLLERLAHPGRTHRP